MKKRMLLVILVMIPGTIVQAQDDFAKNGVYFELLGNGGVYSINYERFVAPNFSIRAGFGSYSGESWWESLFGVEESTLTTFPILGNYFYGEGRNKLELGAGVLVGTKKIKSQWGEEINRTTTIFNLTTVVGYRYQNPEGGIIFRAGLTPFLSLTGEEDAYPQEGFTFSAGASVGYAF